MMAGPARVPWLTRRMLPLLATVGLVAVSMAATTWWGPAMVGKSAWSLPEDLWGTLVAAQRIAHLDLAGLYTPPTALVSFPGTALILVPAVALADAVGVPLRGPGADGGHPGMWLIAGPYEIAVSGVVLFAADALAERLGVARPRRALLAGAGAVLLWNVSAKWGHPEDALAVGLLLLAVLALSDARAGRSAWLAGAAIAVQPLVLLAVPVIAPFLGWRRLAGFAVRAAVPGALTLAAAAAANWAATVPVVTSQPNWPALDHTTPWVFLAPHLSDGAVAAGPGRLLAILAACGCGLAVWARWREARQGPAWSPEMLRDVLWWVAVAFALRSLFEPVMVAYYLWPPLAVALVAAAGNWWRLTATFLAAAAVTFLSQLSWPGPWAWWAPMVAGLALALCLARATPPLRRPDAAGPARLAESPHVR